MTPRARLAAALILTCGCAGEPAGDPARGARRPGSPAAVDTAAAAPDEAASGRTLTVRAYFLNPELGPQPNVDCGMVFPVSRTIPWTAAPARAALEALLAGPTEAERARGYGTSLNEGVTIRGLVVRDGVATVDFSPEMERTGGACLVTAIRAQVESTLTQFPGVRSVRIAIGGNTEEILQP